jgi:diaminopimelate decarboxylase
MMPVPLTELERTCRSIGAVIDNAIQHYDLANVGFALLFFDFGGGGHITYISNAQRDDMRAALGELLALLAAPPARTAKEPAP